MRYVLLRVADHGGRDGAEERQADIANLYGKIQAALVAVHKRGVMRRLARLTEKSVRRSSGYTTLRRIAITVTHLSSHYTTVWRL